MGNMGHSMGGGGMLNQGMGMNNNMCVPNQGQGMNQGGNFGQSNGQGMGRGMDQGANFDGQGMNQSDNFDGHDNKSEEERARMLRELKEDIARQEREAKQLEASLMDPSKRKSDTDDLVSHGENKRTNSLKDCSGACGRVGNTKTIIHPKLRHI